MLVAPQFESRLKPWRTMVAVLPQILEIRGGETVLSVVNTDFHGSTFSLALGMTSYTSRAIAEALLRTVGLVGGLVMLVAPMDPSTDEPWMSGAWLLI